MTDLSERIFIAFSAKDRYSIAEPLVYHLKNYGINVWYDRNEILLSDNRIQKNLVEGAAGCKYAIAIISKNTDNSVCAMEELSIVESRYRQGVVTVFPILYEIPAQLIPDKLLWVKEIIFKEVDHSSGTRGVCNHIACKITRDILEKYTYKCILDCQEKAPMILPTVTHELLKTYQTVDCDNINSRVTLLYAAYLSIIHSDDKTEGLLHFPESHMASKIFERLFAETRLNIKVDYREIWLLENAICILVNNYICNQTEFKI